MSRVLRREFVLEIMVGDWRSGTNSRDLEHGKWWPPTEPSSAQCRQHGVLGGFSQCRMDVDGPADLRHKKLNDFGTLLAERRRTQNRFRLPVDDDLDETVGLTEFSRLAAFRHRSLSSLDALAGLARLRFVQSDSSELWGCEHGIRDNATTLFLAVAEQLGLQHPIVIVRRVGKGRAATDVAGCPNPFDGALQPVIDRDVTLIVSLDADGIKAEIIRVGLTADGQKEWLPS
jgi:hypothetical protein